MLEPSARADTVTPPSTSPAADLMLPLSTASANAGSDDSAVPASVAASAAPVMVKPVVFLTLDPP